MLWHYMVVMGNGLLAKQAMMFLHFRDGAFKTFFLVERTLLILPFLNVRIIQLHKRKFVDLQHNITDRKKLLNFLHQVNVCLQQLICGRRKPAFLSCAIVELCFFVFDADTKDFFLATRKMALDDTNFFCTFANTTILSSGLLYALFRNSTISSDAWDEYETVQKYVPFTAEELAEIAKKKAEEQEALKQAEAAAAAKAQAEADQAENIARIDAINAQVTYTAMMTDTLMVEEEA